MSVKAIAVNPENPSTFVEITPPMPQPGEHDLLVEVKAVSVNPVDTKVHAGIAKSGLKEPRILGWDASGIVKAVGAGVTGFKPGDEVWYAGDITRPGSNTTHQLIDARIRRQRADETDIGTFRGFNRTDFAVMRMVHVAHIESGTFA